MGNHPARFANIYTALQLLQLFERAYEAWPCGDGWVDPFRPFIQPDPFPDRATLAADRDLHLAAVRRMFEEMEAFIFTLGLTEAWRSTDDGAVYPVCPGSRGCGRFDPNRHTFVNFTATDVTGHLDRFLERLREVNPQARVVLTVSPVPLVATMEPRDVLESTVHSKSVLRVAAGEIAGRHPQVIYFPFYEIITATFQTDRYYGADRRTVTPEGVSHVMKAFAATIVATQDRPRETAERAEDAGRPSRGDGGDARAADLPEIVCDEDAAYRVEEDPLALFTIPICDFYCDGQITSYMPAGHPLNSIYRTVLDKLAAGRHVVVDSVDAWLDALAQAAAGRRIIVCFGASHTCMIPNWPFPLAGHLDRLATGTYIVVNAGVSGWSVFNIAEFLPTMRAALSSQGLRIDQAISMDGSNDILFRLRHLYRHFVDEDPQTPSPLLKGEEDFLIRHGYPLRSLRPAAALPVVTPLPEPGGDYGNRPPCFFHPLPEWNEDVAGRCLFSAAVLQEQAARAGIPFLSILQPTASCRFRSPQSQELRRNFRARFAGVERDFFAWRRESRHLLHAGEYMMIIPDETYRIDAVLDLNPPWSRSRPSGRARPASIPGTSSTSMPCTMTPGRWVEERSSSRTAIIIRRMDRHGSAWIGMDRRDGRRFPCCPKRAARRSRRLNRVAASANTAGRANRSARR